MKTSSLLPFLTSAILTTSLFPAFGQANLAIYTDNLVNGMQDWSWATRNMANTSPVHGGTRSISVTSAAWTALSFQHSDINTAPYANISFWTHGGTTGGQRLQVVVAYGPSGVSGPAFVLPTALTANQWTQYTVPLSSLGVANRTDVNRFNIQITASGTTGTFYVDDIQLGAAPAPTLVHVTVDGANSVRGVDPRWFGLNTAIWDSGLDTTITSNLLNELSCLTLRFPGGSSSDEYHWGTGKSLKNSWAWSTSFGNFIHVATNAGVQAFITVNYGTGTSNEAAAWVQSANITNHCNFKYWEIGNECYGGWETDSNSPAHDPYTYAVRAAGYIALMKAADPTIKIGMVAVPGEDSSSNNAAHPATNLLNGTVHYGWTAVMLTTMRNLGVAPDFLIHHVYPQYTDGNQNPVPAADSDALALQTSKSWAADAADLRAQLNGYLGNSSTNVELICTENNSDSGAFGRQLTSVVNALYIADNISQLMKTEFNGYMFWDLRNGPANNGTFDPTLYGWRTYGDEGITVGTSPYTNFPSFYGFKMMQFLARPGDQVLNPASDYLLLSAYAARKPNGSLALLVLNKDTVSNFTAEVSLANFIPSANATVRSYGIPQDELDRTSGPNHDITLSSFAPAGTVFTNTFPPLSLTLFSMPPIEPQVQALGVTSTTSFTLQLQGSPGAPYVLQTSTDLGSGVWTPVSTNTLAGNTLNITNPIDPASPQQFWRAVWIP